MQKYSHGAGTPSATSVAVAFASFKHIDYQKFAKQMNQQSINVLYKAAEDSEFQHLPFNSNFVLFSLKTDSNRFTQEKTKKGISVRSRVFDNNEWAV